MAARRPSAPSTKFTINLEDWEARAPLGELEIRSVNLVKAASEHTSLPFKVGHSRSLRCRTQFLSIHAL